MNSLINKGAGTMRYTRKRNSDSMPLFLPGGDVSLYI